MPNAANFETLAIQAVAYLLNEDKTRQGFLNATGLEEETIARVLKIRASLPVSWNIF